MQRLLCYSRFWVTVMNKKIWRAFTIIAIARRSQERCPLPIANTAHHNNVKIFFKCTVQSRARLLQETQRNGSFVYDAVEILFSNACFESHISLAQEIDTTTFADCCHLKNPHLWLQVWSASLMLTCSTVGLLWGFFSKAIWNSPSFVNLGWYFLCRYLWMKW